VNELPIKFMRLPRISIVTPSFNQGKYVERTVRSVLLQHYPNLDYILMDGGSTDETVSRLAPYRDRFSYYSSQPDNGQAEAIANGFLQSSGEIMAYLNSDDLLAPDTLYFVANYFGRDPDVDCIYSHRCTIDENDRVIGYGILPPHHNSWMKHWDFIPQETCFWRRSLFEKAGNVDSSYHLAMDYDLFVRFMEKGRMRRVNRFFSAFRQHRESKTAQLFGNMGRREMLRVRQKYGISRLPREGFFETLLSWWMGYAGNRFAASGRRLPGAWPEVGYDYNDFWGGVLRGCDRSERNQPNRSKKSPYEPVCPITLRFPDRLLFSLTSTRNGGALGSDVYVQESFRTAIILPSLGKQWRKAKNKIWDDQDTGIPEASAQDPGLPRQSALEILGLVRGLIADSDEIAFLEVDCHSGELLDELKSRTKWKLAGLEASPTAAKGAISKGYQVYEATLAEAPTILEITERFNVIYLRRGIERFDEPRVSLRKVAFLLNPGGFLILTTPNLDFEGLKRFGPAWPYWKPEEHRFIYSRKSLKAILALGGFELVNFWTVSSADSSAPLAKAVRDRDASAPISGEGSDRQNNLRAEVMTRSSQLLRNGEGKGDLIFAICRRSS
jgi:glycosyltransferase involved in cell wall biosynthesis/SAM-dependent methyltransferase